nr:hypothetical protein [Tanacetum cinerariifolium]
SNLAAADAAIREGKGGHYPSLSFNLGASQSDVGYDNTLTPRSDSYVATIGLKVPIYSGGSTSARVSGLYDEQYAAEQDLEGVRRQVVKETTNAYLTAQSAVDKIRAGQNALSSAKQSSIAAQKAFAYGVVNAVDVLTAVQNEFKARGELLKSQYDFITNLFILNRWAGKLSQESVASVNVWLGGDDSEALKDLNNAAPNARSRPNSMRSARSASLLKTSSMAREMLVGSSGSTAQAALPVTSGSEVVLEAMTGHLAANASMTGRPKPSYKEAKTSAPALCSTVATHNDQRVLLAYRLGQQVERLKHLGQILARLQGANEQEEAGFQTMLFQYCVAGLLRNSLEVNRVYAQRRHADFFGGNPHVRDQVLFAVFGDGDQVISAMNASCEEPAFEGLEVLPDPLRVNQRNGVHDCGNHRHALDPRDLMIGGVDNVDVAGNGGGVGQRQFENAAGKHLDAEVGGECLGYAAGEFGQMATERVWLDSDVGFFARLERFHRLPQGPRVDANAIQMPGTFTSSPHGAAKTNIHTRSKPTRQS